MNAYNSELVIALTSAVGTDISIVKKAIEEELKTYGYRCHVIKISRMLLEPLNPGPTGESNYNRANRLMDQGNEMRRKSKDNGILAKGAISLIRQHRSNSDVPEQSTAYLIDSLKNPEEIKILREVYGSGVYLFAINESELFRRDNLIKAKNMGEEDARKLCKRDLDEGEPFGQNTRGVFELADFHLSLNGWEARIGTDLREVDENKKAEEKKHVVQGQLERILKAMFSCPFITPTFDEYAMFMAYSAGLRSADLSRQIGAVIANNQQEIIALGANDCPRFGGGQYWPVFNKEESKYYDVQDGRDYMRGYDSNKREHARIVNEILEIFNFENNEKGKHDKEEARRQLNQSRIKFLTEYGRPVHAEMSAILSCARTGVSLQGATLYCSTFPCHNCAKHIIGAGIKRVVYIEPYPKSKSVELYQDSMCLADASMSIDNNRVRFEEFVGIGPRRFYDLFSLSLGSGASLKRKDSDGKALDWKPEKGELRCKLNPLTYFEREKVSSGKYGLFLQKKENEL